MHARTRARPRDPGCDDPYIALIAVGAAVAWVIALHVLTSLRAVRGEESKGPPPTPSALLRTVRSATTHHRA